KKLEIFTHINLKSLTKKKKKSLLFSVYLAKLNIEVHSTCFILLRIGDVWSQQYPT
ncbi:hypothetical protein ACH5RR_040282, partial [Cinchona calisaya]